jgi:uncharacterized protein YecE (DUF72 family)
VQRGREGNYSAREIAAWTTKIAAWRRRGDVFAYFNNDWHDYAVRNALDLRSALQGGADAALAPGGH